MQLASKPVASHEHIIFSLKEYKVSLREPWLLWATFLFRLSVPIIGKPLLQKMLTGAWRWSAPAPHYGTGIPLREDVAFALGLCTDLLQFAGQVLRAHPDRIIRQREETI